MSAIDSCGINLFFLPRKPTGGWSFQVGFSDEFLLKKTTAQADLSFEIAVRVQRHGQILKPRTSKFNVVLVIQKSAEKQHVTPSVAVQQMIVCLLFLEMINRNFHREKIN